MNVSRTNSGANGHVAASGTHQNQTPKPSQDVEQITPFSGGKGVSQAPLRENESPRAPTIMELEKYEEKTLTKIDKALRFLGDCFKGLLLGPVGAIVWIRDHTGKLMDILARVDNMALSALVGTFLGPIILSLLLFFYILCVVFGVIAGIFDLAASLGLLALKSSAEKFAQKNNIDPDQLQRCSELFKKGPDTTMNEEQLRAKIKEGKYRQDDTSIATEILNGIKNLDKNSEKYEKYKQLSLNMAAALIMPWKENRQKEEWNNVVKQWNEMVKKMNKDLRENGEFKPLLTAGNELVKKSDPTNIKQLAKTLKKLENECNKVVVHASLATPLIGMIQHL